MFIEPPNTNLRITNTSIIATIPEYNTVTSTHTCQLNLPSFLPKACEGRVFPQFLAGALLSIGILYDHECIAELDITSIRIKIGGAILLHRIHSPATRIWCIDPME